MAAGPSAWGARAAREPTARLPSQPSFIFLLLWVRMGGVTRPITDPWSTPVGSAATEWQMLAAETVGGTNRVLWRNNAAQFLHVWTLDANWNWISSGAVTGFGSATAWTWELDFQVHANGDGRIGAP